MVADPGMSSTLFNTEYDLLDSDDSAGNSPLPFLEFINDSDALQSLQASRSGDPKGVLLASNPQHLAVPLRGASSDSPNASYQDSASDSSSSKRTESSSTSIAGMTAADVTMMDGLDMKAEPDWDHETYGKMDGNAYLFDGTIDPSSIENTFAFNDRSMEDHFDFASASDSPSPFATTTTDALSPQSQPTGPASSVKASPSASKSPARGHNKGFSQYSLTQSMNDLHTNGSREVSPNMVFSQDSSPSALLTNSPSPANPTDFTNAPATGFMNGSSVWPQGLNLPNASGPMEPPASVNYSTVPQPAISQLFIGSTPSKSRVETQIPIKMSLTNLPPGIKRLHLPRYTISKPKLLAKPRPAKSSDMLELYTMLVCTSAMQKGDAKRRAFARAAAIAHSRDEDLKSPEGSLDDDDKPQNGGEVKICEGCIVRERKRAARKKAKKVEEEETWSKDERKRVVVFNTQEVKEWQMPTAIAAGTKPPDPILSGAMQIDAPMRIACYCRHHGEKSGFQVIFTIKDHQDNLIAQAMSPSIMITDDHKTHPIGNGSAESTNNSETALAPPAPPAATESTTVSSAQPFRPSHSVSDLQGLKRNVSVTFPLSVAPVNTSQPTSTAATPRILSRPASPTGLSGPSSKKRKASASPKVPSGLAMTRLETADLAAAQAANVQNGSAGAISPFTPSLPSFSGSTADGMFGQTPAVAGTAPNPFTTGPPTPNSNDQVLFSTTNRSGSLDNLSMTQLYSAPTSAHPSRAPSPNGIRNSANAMQQQQQQQQNQLSQAIHHNLFNLSMPVPLAATRQPPSVIHKVIPNEGPISGGIEVTILGEGFYQGLEVLFGDRRATTTTFWGETSLVCLLPPSHIAGPVLVTLKQPNNSSSQPFPSVTKQPAVFNYIDDYENQLIRSALSVMSHKMTGKIEDARDIARRLVSDLSAGGVSGGDGFSGNGNGYSLNFETQLLRVLEFLDLDDSTNKARLNLRRRSGHTMLHLACAMGMHRFVAGLLARGANPDVRDKGGYTPLHFAALNDQPEIVRRLICAGADPTIRSISGLTPAEVSQSRDVLRAIRRLERHARSRSGGSLHSRASSATSLRSLWEPPSPAPNKATEFSTEESESAEESPEYTSGDFSSEDVDADEVDGSWLDMRRGSTPGTRAREASTTNLLQIPDAEVPAGLASPSAAMTAFRDQCTTQFQQFQQAMAMHLQNLPHFPYFPQMPNMPPLPDYQAYLNSAPVLQRMSSFLPNIGGSRPGSAGDQSQPKDVDTRWWDLSSLMTPSAAPPPSYEEIYPQNDLDKKQASAAQAAAEAEADSKCAALYDQPSTSTAPPPQLPALLQIGRKNAITKEQRDNLRRAHAEKFKRLSSDRNLFFVWIPLLLVIMCAMLYSRFPGLFSFITDYLPALPSLTKFPGTEDIRERIVEVN